MSQTQLTEHHSVTLGAPLNWELFPVQDIRSLYGSFPQELDSMKLLGLFQLRLFCDSDFLALPVQGADPKKHKPLVYPVSELCAQHFSQNSISPLFLSPTIKPPQPDTGVFNSARAGQGWPLQAQSDLPSLESWFGGEGGQHTYF